MCGVVATFGADLDVAARGVAALIHRGPDADGLTSLGKVALGHTRLAILDLDGRSDQPFAYGDVLLSYNGELWNYLRVKADLEALGKTFGTTGDTEVVAAALDTWGVDALPRLNGMFALAWTVDGETLHLARDRYGEVPLHLANQWPFCAASEKKALLAMGAHPKAIEDVGPGERVEVTKQGVRRMRWYDVPLTVLPDDLPTAATAVGRLIENGAGERTIADVPVCTLLSGGVDSAAVAAVLARRLPRLVAYTAVLDPKSADLRCARQTADYLGIELREVRVPVPTTDDLARVIATIELPHKAQVEIGWACLRLAEVIKGDGFKVTYSGEGSDELWASYGFAYHALQTQDWHAYRKELFLTQARKNFPRCNKVFMAHSVECRLPFLHPPLVEYAIGLRQDAVQDGRARPKAVIQDAFIGALPPDVLRRPKVAFQDGMGLKAAIAARLPAPERFYRAEYATRFN